MRTKISMRNAFYVLAVGTKAMVRAELGESIFMYGSTSSKRRGCVDLAGLVGGFLY